LPSTRSLGHLGSQTPAFRSRSFPRLVEDRRKIPVDVSFDGLFKHAFASPQSLELVHSPVPKEAAPPREGGGAVECPRRRSGLRLPPLIGMPLTRAPHPLYQRMTVGIELPSPVDGFSLRRQHVARPLGIWPSHRIVTLRPTLDKQLVLRHPGHLQSGLKNSRLSASFRRPWEGAADCCFVCGRTMVRFG